MNDLRSVAWMHHQLFSAHGMIHFRLCKRLLVHPIIHAGRCRVKRCKAIR